MINSYFKGASGSVYKGTYKKTAVAIKLIPLDQVSESQLNNLQSEAMTMK